MRGGIGKESMEVIKPKDREHWLKLRTKDITSTEVSMLFNCCPYGTDFELWHRKKSGKVVELEQTSRMKWGTRLQNTIAAGVAEDHGWNIRRMDEYIRIPGLRIGSSLDFGIDEDGLLEIKNVDGLIFRNEWTEEDKKIEAPPHIELQLQHQLLVTGRQYGYIAALVGGNRLILIKREADPNIHKGIKAKVLEFWDSIDSNIEPTADYGRDASFIAELYGFAEPGKIVDATDQVAKLAQKYKNTGDQIRVQEALKREIRAQILVEIGDAEKVKDELFSITAGMIGPAIVPQHERKGYRAFRVNWKKPKAKGA